MPLKLNAVGGGSIELQAAPTAGNYILTLPAESGYLGPSIPAGTAMLFVQTAAPTGWTKSATHNNKALRVVSGTASSGGSVAFTTAFASQAVSGTNSSYTLTTTDIPGHTHSFSYSGTTSLMSNDHTHYTSGTTGTVSADHNHSISGNTNLVTNFPGGASAANGAQTAGNTGGTQVTFSGTTGGASANHTHSFGATSGGVSANHSHTFSGSGTTGSTGSSGGHTHTFTGTAIDLAVQYVDVIIATKD